MDFDLTIAILKVVGALAGGILGSAAIFSDFHNTATGKLSAWGKAVLTGIIVSSSVGVVTSVIETWKAENETKEQTARTNAILKEISRSIQPITEMRLNAWMEVPRSYEVVNRYATRLQAGISERLSALGAPMTAQPPSAALKGLEPWARSANGAILNVEIGPESDLWPNRDSEVELNSMLMFGGFSIYITKTPIDPEKFQPLHGGFDFDALSFDFGKAKLAWDVPKKELLIISDLEFPRNLWHTNGKISSTVDLKGSQIFLLTGQSYDIKLDFPIVSPDIKQVNTREISRSLLPKTVTLTLGGGRSLHIAGSHFRKTKFVGGFPVFSIVIPSDDAGIERLSKD